jgi:hypothetical protein
MRVLALAVVLAGCGAAAEQAPPGPGVAIRIADVTDCGGSGTTCPELTSERRLRVGLDGSAVPLEGEPLRFAPGHGARSFGLRLDAGRVRVVWPDRSNPPLDMRLRGFGRDPHLSWSPSGARFALLEEIRERRTDRVLVVDPARRRTWRLPLAARVREIWALAWESEDRLVAEIIGRDEVLRLAELDAVTGRVLRSRLLDRVLTEISWSPVTRRLAFEDSERAVGVLALDHPTDIHWTRLEGVPAWSPDGARILVTHPACDGCPRDIPLSSDGVDTRDPQLVAWPSGETVKLPQWLTSGTWLPDGHTLVALYSPRGKDEPAKLVQIGDGGQIGVVPVQWPARVDPDNEFSLAPNAVPQLLEGLVP